MLNEVILSYPDFGLPTPRKVAKPVNTTAFGAICQLGNKVQTTSSRADLADCCRRMFAGHEQFHFSISEAQFKWMESGATLASSSFVLIRNLCPSPLTS